MPGGSEPAGAGQRRILFLQGPLAPLYKLMGADVRKAGHQVFRINLCAGDWLHWHGAGCVSYRGTAGNWPAYIDTFLKEKAITDLVLHGDQRIYHRAAIEAAMPLGIQIAVTELGYLRPGWMTLEKNGLSTLSHFPAKPDEIRHISQAAGVIDFSPRFPGSQWLQIVPDVIYNLTNVFFSPFYPHYQRHTIYHPIPEYVRGAIRMAGENKRNAAANAALQALVIDNTPYFVLPLQLEGDFQLRRHSPYKSFAEVIDHVIASFARSAPAETHLVLKSHPLDVGYENWPDVIAGAEADHGLKGRIRFLDGGNLAEVFKKARGVVTLNSTAGVEALQAGVPVKTLVPAHYDINGLTHSRDLESFWTTPETPDAALLDDYLRALAATIQVRGSIHNTDGLPVAARNMAERILARQLNEPGAFVDPPPRLEAARFLGVPL